MNNVKRSFLTSLISLVLCLTMFLGTTFAWFTDIVVSGGNIIQSGKLDAEMYWSDEYLASTDSGWTQVKDNKPIFTYDNWEPGYTEIKYIKVANAGNLNFKWKLSIEAEGKVTDLSDVIDVYYVNPVNGELTKQALAARTPDGKLTDVLANKTATEGDQLTPGGSVVLAIAFHMDELAGNEYQEKSLCDKGFSLKLLATQATGENDSFDDQYDKESEWPEIPSAGNNASADVPTDTNGVVTTETTITGNGMSATVPAGTQLTQGTNKLTLSVNNVEDSKANVTLAEGEELRALDVHISGVAEGNTTPIAVTLTEALPKGLNIGNYTLHHVEDGQTVPMTLLADSATPVHNNFTYDPVTGDVTLYMASFSEVDLIAEPAKWEGNRDYTWYDAHATELQIANADQLAAFGAIVGGMKKVTGRVDGKYSYSDDVILDSFAGKTVKLVADINLGDKESENNPKVIFYPIGYYNSEGTYERTNTAITSGLRIFEGTFDGNGHTIANFYQNTWEMKGDHNWYDPIKEQYYRDGMGLFGRVYKGTVKNLTVKNFSSDGEIATTGVIAAYADGATFENIAIFNCNPRVYNIGNGGIVGCVGWYAKEAGLTTTFKNITVDNSNKISALWGSYDVACGGIVGQYYPTSGQTSAGTPKNAGMHFENCHVSAVMDVYNDVCANYQYYAYRYTGMLIGSVRENVTIDGHSYPKMDGITAKDCTVHFGTWNDYYYCEIIDNTTASYTHDYQMSRLTEIKAIDGTTITYLDGTTGTVPASGRANYVIVDYTKGHGTENATCYHFKDGAVWTHDMGGIQTGIDENGDGQDDLKEDKQHIYLEFNNLVTGYGWGVTSKGVGDLAGVTILDREVGNSVEKFEGKVNKLENNKIYKFGDIFTFVDNGVELVPGALAVSVTNLDENNPVSATIIYDRDNWENSTIAFKGAGKVQITIQDYYFCTPTTITVEIKDRQPEVKFETKFTGDFLYRVGNQNAVALGSLFKAKDGAKIGTVSVTVETITGASGTYTSNATWTNGTIQFNGTGVVKVTITDNDYCTPTVLFLEVVDATNVTGLSGTLSGNVVLLNDCGLSSLTVSGRNTVFGNGFTATYTGNGQYLRNGLKQGVVTVSENGTLDNLKIKASIYPSAFMYYGPTQLGEYVQQDSNPTDIEGIRYYYQLSAVAVSGNATISNCYIYGGRTNIFVNTGDVTIKDTILECGTVANVQIQSNASHTITLENVTTIQYQVNPTLDNPETSKDDTQNVMLGAGILVGPETSENPKIVLNGEFKQYNWVTADDENAVSTDTTKMIINGALNKTAYNHTVNGKTASNLGIIYMNTYTASVENKTGLPYVLGNVTLTANIGISASVDGQVYSVQGASGTQIYGDYENADRSTVNGLYKPQFKYDSTLGGQYIEKDSGDEHLYREGDTIYVLFPSGDTKEVDLAKLVNIVKYTGQDLQLVIAVKDENGNDIDVTDGKVSLSSGGKYTVTYKVTDALFHDNDGNTISKSIDYTWSITIDVSLKDIAILNAYFEFDSTKQIMGYNGSGSRIVQFIPFLAGLKIHDYNSDGTAYLRFNGDDDFDKLEAVDIVGYESNKASIEVKLTDGGLIKIKFLARADSGGSTYTGSIKTLDNTIYYVNGGQTKATTTTWTIDYYKFTGNNGVEIDSGKIVFQAASKSTTKPTGTFGSTDDGGNCVTPDTLVTLADGTQVRVDSLKGDEMLLVWNMETGKFDFAPIMFVDSEAEAEFEVIKLYFSDGTEVKVVYEHGFWDYDLNKYVYLDRNAADYIGHTFAKQNGDKLEKVTLTDVVIETELTTAWSPVTVGHLCYFVNGMLSMPGGVGGLFNIFEVDPETMTYDYEQLEKDIETYGLFTYEELNAICPLTEEMFNAAGGAYLKISIGKGNLTMEELIDMINRYSKFI